MSREITIVNLYVAMLVHPTSLNIIDLKTQIDPNIVKVRGLVLHYPK
jgi:hypothetical protein